MIDQKNAYIALQQNRKIKIFFLILFLAIILALGYIFRYYFWPFIFAVIFFLGLNPINEFLFRYVKKRSISSSIMVFILLIMVLLPLFLLLLALANQSYEFYQFISKKFNSAVIIEFIHRSPLIHNIYGFLNITEGELVQSATETLQELSLSIFSNLTGLMTFSIKFIVNFFFMMLILFFLFCEGKQFMAFLYKILPFPDDIEQDIFNRLNEVIKVLLAGNVLIMALQGSMVGLGFFIIGLKTALLWGSISAVLSLIPVIGTSIVWLPAVVYHLIIGEYFNAMFLGGWCLVWYLVLENVVKPIVFGDRLHFHPLLFFFLLLGSLQAFNLPGIVVGPILLTLFYSFWEIYKILDEYDRSGVTR